MPIITQNHTDIVISKVLLLFVNLVFSRYLHKENSTNVYVYIAAYHNFNLK